MSRRKRKPATKPQTAPKQVASKVAAPFQRITNGGIVPIEQRHWDGAVRDAEKNNQWCLADGRHINSVLVDSLKTVQDRCLYETRINPTVEGTIETHKSDVVGKDGPKLQVQTDDDAFNEMAERIFREEFAESADSTGKLSIGDYLKLGMESLWNVGSIFSQIIYDSDAETLLKTKLHAITPQRLSSPYDKTGDPLHLLGVERNKAGRPVRYHITEETDDYRYGYPLSYKTIAVPASSAICEFKMHQEGQVLGFPWLSSSLQCQEDLRGYDQSVLDAAKTAAILAVLAYSTGDMAADAPDGTNTIDPKRFTPGAINFMPEQWQPMMLNPTQPANNHVEYRSERQREIGRPVGMPLMQIRLDSSGHNYSSARFDASIYNRANLSIQNWLERQILRRMFRLIMAEAMAVGLLPRRNIREIAAQWNWDQPPHVDPVKEAMAERIRLENKTLSPQLACASHGIDFEQLCRDWARANATLKANGLPEMLGPVPGDLQSLKAYLDTSNASDQAA